MGNLKQRAVTLLTLFFLTGGFLCAQGAISGTIVDKASGETVIGAYIVIQGTTNGTTTDFDGKYSLRLDPGSYVLEYSYTGYPTQIVEGITVVDGEVTYQDVTMSDEEGVALELNVTVTAERLTNTEVAVLVERKESIVISDNLSVQEMARYGASDASGALKKVTGASVSGGKYVFIRGLGDRYSLTQLNGLIMPSTDPYRNSAQLDLIPTNLVDNISTSKTFTPDQPGNFTGGNIDIRTKKFPDLKTISISVSGGYNSQSNLTDNFLTHEGGSNDYLGYDNARAIPEVFSNPESRQFLSRTGVNMAAAGDPAATEAIQGSFASINNKFVPETNRSNLDHGLAASYGNKFKVGANTLGVIATASFKQDYQHLEDYGTANFEVIDFESDTLEPRLDIRTDRSVLNPTTSGLVGLAYRIGPSHELSFTGMYNHTSEKISRRVQGSRPDNLIAPRLLQGYQLSFIEQEMFNYQLGGEHNFPKLNNAKIEWRTSLVNSSQIEPQTRFFENTFNTQTGVYGGFDGADVNSPILFWRDLEDEQQTGKIDLTLPIGKKKGTSLKFGGYYSNKDRSSTQDQFNLQARTASTTLNELGGDVNEFTSAENSGVIGPDPRREGRQLVGNYLADMTRFQDSYTGFEKITAAYGMGVWQVTDNLKLVGGLRVETTDMESVSRDTAAAVGKIDEVDFLPSANVIYEVVEDFNIRATWSKTLVRPNMREISSFVIFDPLINSFERGNPDSLSRGLVDNFDLRLEYFPGGNEVIAISGYYKDFQDPIIRQRLASSNLEFQYDNTPSGWLYGIELEVRKNLGFLTSALNNFYLASNATYIQSEVETQAGGAFSSDSAPFLNQPKYIVNAALNFLDNDKGWDVALSLNSVGDQLVALSNVAVLNQTLEGRSQLDFVASKRLGDNVRVRASILNITNDPYRLTTQPYNGRTYVYENFQRGVDFRFGLTYTIK